MRIQEHPSQSLELFLAVTPLGKLLLMRGMFPNVVSVGENTTCSRMQRMLHSPGIRDNFYVSKILLKLLAMPVNKARTHSCRRESRDL